MSVKQSDFWYRVARRLGNGATPQSVKRYMQAISDEIAETLKLRGEFKWAGFGSFSTKYVSGKTKVMGTFIAGQKEEVYIPEHYELTFSTSDRVKDIINCRGEGTYDQYGNKTRTEKKTRKKKTREEKMRRERKLDAEHRELDRKKILENYFKVKQQIESE